MNQARAGRLPDFVIIGAAKSGTTSADHYLRLHPEVYMDRPKEINFFINPPMGNWHRGADWYRSRFRHPHAICGDASPGYTAGPDAGPIPQRMAALIPQAKLIYILREPVARLRSDYLMRLRLGWLPPGTTFSAYIEQSNDWIAQAEYGQRLSEFREYYPAKQILVMESQDLHQNRSESIQKLYQFIGVDPSFQSPGFDSSLNTKQRQAYPNRLAGRVLRSRTYNRLAVRSPEQLRHYAETALRLLLPSSCRPELTLTPAAAHRIADLIAEDLPLLRRLTGLALTTLEPMGLQG